MVSRGRFAALAPLAAAALWGAMYVVSKWGFSAVPPVTLAFLRVAVGGAALLFVVRVAYPDRRFARRDRRGFAVLGGWVTLTLVAQFLGTELTTASQGALVTVLTPVFTLALGVAWLGEAFTARRAAGTLLALAGTVAVLAGQYDLRSATSASAAGVALLLVASVGWAAYTVRGKRLVREYSALETATYSTLAAVPMHAALVPVELAVRDVSLAEVPTTPEVLAAVLYLGLASTAAAWYLWYKGLETVDAATLSAFFFAQPAVGAGLGYALLGETVGPLFVGGGAAMAVGIYVVGGAGANGAAER